VQDRTRADERMLRQPIVIHAVAGQKTHGH
jgi:hypothetical protein